VVRRQGSPSLDLLMLNREADKPEAVVVEVAKRLDIVFHPRAWAGRAYF
jgi:hypothetical protein